MTIEERRTVLGEAAKMLNEWADADFVAGNSETGDALKTAAICVSELADPLQTQCCGCDGCAEQVPRYWRSGFCRPCASEECEHEDADETP
jgi:hypothetical protein